MIGEWIGTTNTRENWAEKFNFLSILDDSREIEFIIISVMELFRII